MKVWTATGVTVLLLGANHDTAAVAVRECLAIPAERIVDTLRFLSPATGELAVISTCNRTEFYAASPEAERYLRDFIYRHSRLDPGVLDHALYRLDGRDAVRHLLRVACGLNSMIVGEPQILGQVRDAIALARQAGSSGPVIQALFQTALNAGKTARARTGIARGAVSVSQAAVELARDRLGGLEERTALVVGAGDTATGVARNLRSHGIGRLIIANRTLARAAQLAADLNAEAVALDELAGSIHAAELVISSTGAPELVITPDLMRAHGGAGPTVMIDIAVPRDIDPAVGELAGVALYDLDDLRGRIDANISQRMSAAGEIEDDVESRADAFMSWLSGHRAGPTIRDLYEHAEQLRIEQYARALRRLPSLSDRERQLLEIFSVQMTNALLHQPVSRLWNTDTGAADAAAIRRLFDLDDGPEGDSLREDGPPEAGSAA
jgi:glutamyl-tRNA reductase